MNFENPLSDRFSQRWAALNEVPAALAATIGKAALDSASIARQANGLAVHSSNTHLLAWITLIIVIPLWPRQS